MGLVLTGFILSAMIGYGKAAAPVRSSCWTALQPVALSLKGHTVEHVRQWGHEGLAPFDPIIVDRVLIALERRILQRASQVGSSSQSSILQIELARKASEVLPKILEEYRQRVILPSPQNLRQPFVNLVVTRTMDAIPALDIEIRDLLPFVYRLLIS